MPNELTDPTPAQILEVAQWLGFNPIHYKQGCGNCDLGVEIYDPLLEERRYWRPDVSRDDLALAWPVLEERGLWGQFLDRLRGLLVETPIQGREHHHWVVHTAPAQAQFWALYRTMEDAKK